MAQLWRESSRDQWRKRKSEVRVRLERKRKSEVKERKKNSKILNANAQLL